MRLSVSIGAALLAGATAVCAQAERERIFPNAEAAKAARAKAAKACAGKEGIERGECLRRETCAQAPDPAQCDARVKEAIAKRERMREACKDKKGDEYRACLRAERGKT
jgi:hypothetical protein